MTKNLIYFFAFSSSLILALLHQTSKLGNLSLIALLISFCIRPFVQVFPRFFFAKKILSLRRQIGNTSAIYLAGHILSQLSKNQSLPQLFDQALKSHPTSNLFWGSLGLLVMIPLVITSNDLAVRLLKKNWKKVHLLIHPLVVFVLIHKGLREGYSGLVQSFFILAFIYGLRVLAKIKS